jgi:hypothetical protein
MHTHHPKLVLPALALALAMTVPAAAAAADGQPDFTGTWVFVRQTSDDVRQKVLSAVGSGSTVGSDKSEQTRVWIRTWLDGFAESADKRTLTIEQDEKRFQAGLGDEVNNYYFGREAAGSGPAGGRVKVTVAWQGQQLVTEEKLTKGKGRMRSTYTMLPGGRMLQLDWLLEHDSFEKPLEVRLVFEKAKE